MGATLAFKGRCERPALRPKLRVLFTEIRITDEAVAIGVHLRGEYVGLKS